MNWFSIGTGKKIDNIVEEIKFVLDGVEKDYYYVIYIGTDGQHFGKKTRVVTNIILRKMLFVYGNHRRDHGKGGIGYFWTEKVDRMTNIHAKMLAETAHTVSALELIKPVLDDYGIDYEIHIDISDLPDSLSSQTLSSIRGWLSAYVTSDKGDVIYKKHNNKKELLAYPWAASCIADKLVRSKTTRKIVNDYERKQNVQHN